MRTAICFSGQIERLYHEHGKFVNQLRLCQSDCDLFFSFWGKQSDEIDLRNFLSIVLPSNIRIAAIQFTPPYEWSSPYNQSHVFAGNTLPAMFLQAGGIKLVDELRQRYEQQYNFKYDMVIRSRADIEIKGEFDLFKFNNILINDTNLILTPSNWRFSHAWDCPERNTVPGYLGQKCMCEQWWAATSDNMSRVTNYGDFFNEYISNGARVHPETLLWWHVEKILKLDIKVMDFRNILRGIDEN